jgi:HlyD family secretion protein
VGVLELEQTGTQAQSTPPSGAPPRVKVSRPGFPKWLFAVLAVIAVALVGYILTRDPKATVSASAGTATAKRADFVQTRRIHGTVEAVSFYAIAAPRLSGPGLGSLIVTKLTGSGKQVKKGDLLVEFDRQQQIRNAFDRQAEYVDFIQQIKKKEADEASAAATDKTALTQAESTMKSAELELRRNEIVSAIDAEKNRQNFEEAKATYNQLKTTFALKRRAAQAELRALEIQRDRAKNAMEYAQTNTEKLSIKSPIDGIVVLNTIWKGGQMGEVQEGDEVRAGVPFMQVVNAGTMQVRARVNQADASLLSAGLPVKIGLDAYPELGFDGKVERVAAIGVTSTLSTKVRTFQALFSIVGTDAKLMPDLSASVDVQLNKLANKIVVPRDAVVRDGGKAYVLVGNGSNFERREVTLAAMGDLEAAIESGLEEGTTVLRSAAGK